MKNLISLLSIFVAVQIIAQPPEIEWAKCYGSSGNDIARCIKQTTDGGFIIAGQSNFNDGHVSGNKGNYDCWIVKTDSDGDIVWQRSLGGNNKDIANSIYQTADGGFIMAGATSSLSGDVSFNFGNSDFWVVKLDTLGEIEWEKSLGGSNLDEAKSVMQTKDGGYIVAGSTHSQDGYISVNHGKSDYWVVKLDTIGDVEWQRTYGGSETDEASSIQQTTDGGYIVAGSSRSNDWEVENSHYNPDLWVLKLDSLGNIQWQINLGGDDIDKAHDVKQTPDGGFIIAGEIESITGDIPGNHGLSDCAVIKLNNSGSIEWKKALGGSNWDRCYCVEPTQNGGYILTGTTTSYDGDLTEAFGGYDVWIIELTQTGEIIWQKSLGGTGNDKAYGVIQTTDEGFVICGESNSMTGDVSDNLGNEDFWIVKLSKSVTGVSSVLKNNFTVFPNPTSAFITIREIFPSTPITITNIQGKTVYQSFAVSENQTIDISKLPEGMYFLNGQKFIKVN